MNAAGGPGMEDPRDDFSPPAKEYLYRLCLNALINIPRLCSLHHFEDKLRIELARLDGTSTKRERIY